MEKIGTKTIEVNSGTKLDFDVYPCNCKVGDTVWFDDGIECSHFYIHGKVTKIEPDHWWIYDDGEKELGRITVQVEDDEFYAGQNFTVAFKDIIYEEPIHLIMENVQNVLESAQKTKLEFDEMSKNIEFLQNEYKTNKKYFRPELGRCTVDDVIKTVFEFAWAASKNYNVK